MGHTAGFFVGVEAIQYMVDTLSLLVIVFLAGYMGGGDVFGRKKAKYGDGSFGTWVCRILHG